MTTGPRGARPSERECQATIIEAAQRLGYLVHAERPARASKGWTTPIEGDAGWPDLVIAGHGHLFVRELKRHPNGPSNDQRRWLLELHRAGIDANVLYVPDAQETFIGWLNRIAMRARTT